MGSEWLLPEIHIWDVDNRPRSLEYVRFIPWVEVGGYFHLPIDQDPRTHKVFHGVYTQMGSPDFHINFHGFDAVVGMNGNMRNGVPFQNLLMGADINWHYGPEIPVDVTYGFDELRKGPYFVLCFSDFGMFREWWCRVMPSERVWDMIFNLKHMFPTHRFIFTGSPWDLAFSEECMGDGDVSLVGQTSLVEFLSLLQHSDGYIGWCGGNSIVAQHLGIPTVVWWSRRYFPRHDRRGWETPEKYGGGTQMVLEVEDFEREDTIPMIRDYLKARMRVHG